MFLYGQATLFKMAYEILWGTAALGKLSGYDIVSRYQALKTDF